MSEWLTSTLLAASERVDYGFTASSTNEPIGPRFLRITDIDGSHVDWASVPFCIANATEESKYALANHDIVVARTGASTGRSQWIKLTEPSLFASYLVRFRIRPEFDSRFVSYVLQTRDWHDHVDSVAFGKSAQPNMSAGAMSEFRFKHPRHAEQQSIAEVLGALDDKIAANTALAAKADELASTAYDALTASWPRLPMSEVLTPVLGGTPPRAREEHWEAGTNLWISARDITSALSHVVLDTAEKITRAAIVETKAKPLPAGSVILTARGTVGEVARLARPASFNQSCYGFRPDPVPPGLLYFSVLRATQHAKAIAHGSVFDTITKSTFDHLSLAWDPQSAVRVESAIAPPLALVAGVLEENRTLAATRDMLLPQLMSGKLRVRDAGQHSPSSLAT